MELICCVQKYHWGKLGSNSLVAKLAKCNSAAEIDPETTYAELWMGIHPAGPSRLKDLNISLEDFISQQPDVVGSAVQQVFGQTLPFLFKVLSVRTALSIQAHPSKPHAEELFKKFPKIYKDDNHKPEIAIAVTDFQALCGFRPREEIKKFLNEVPELRELIGEERVVAFDNENGLKACFGALMSCSEDKVQKAIKHYLAESEDTQEKEIIKELNRQFPGDVGVLCVFWLNYVTLKPGEALFLGPNEPHAYLYGDCVECMANSDNVVRAGLTPKFRHVSTLCQMLTYISYERDAIKFLPILENEFTKLFKPPVNDFAVALISIPAGRTCQLIPRASASIILTMNGAAKTSRNAIKPGSILFVPSDEILTVNAESALTMYQAFCNI